MTLIETAAAQPLFRDLSAEEVARVLTCTGAAIINFSPGECIAQSGHGVLHVGILLSGTAELCFSGLNGEEHTVYTLLPDELFGLSALLSPGEDTLPCCVIAQSSGTALILDAARIRSACTENCAAHRKLVTNALAETVRMNNQLRAREYHLEQKTMRQKILTYLAAQARATGSATFTVPLDRRQMAEYLGVDRTALSAELSRMKKAKIIDCHLRQFTLYTSYSNNTNFKENHI